MATRNCGMLALDIRTRYVHHVKAVPLSILVMEDILMIVQHVVMMDT